MTDLKYWERASWYHGEGGNVSALYVLKPEFMKPMPDGSQRYLHLMIGYDGDRLIALFNQPDGEQSPLLPHQALVEIGTVYDDWKALDERERHHNAVGNQ